ncbi:WD repeat-containing protein on Y chromosome-like [Dendronephthya gigantea]|uniref:WD repeat-containing protein on Y chromosome-like n=1 Tax=Dendronephthya gigantea TaxID=151771 RepID=UPI00106BB671|nr:WD repeat-containing protein on Y chromosome-like [Dendronephthya gigantea]
MKKSKEINQNDMKVFVPRLHRRQRTQSKDIKEHAISCSKQRDSVQLEEELSLLQLKKLMRLFKQHKPEQKHRTFSNLPSRAAGKPGYMNLDEFDKALNKALHDQVLTSEIEELFRKVDISSDGLVDWDELSSYILLRLQERELLRSTGHGKVFQNPPKIVKIEKCKEPTSRILVGSNPTRYITVGKDGFIRVWTADLVQERFLRMDNGDQSFNQSASSKRKIWVTDAVIMKNVNKLAVCTTNMDIYFYDMSTPVYTPQFHLCALGVVAFCLEYHYDKKNPANQSLLFYGDDKGQVHVLIFHKPFEGLFETPFKKHGGCHVLFLQEAMSSQSHLVSHVLVDELHSDWLRRLRYYHSNDMLMSCSGNSRDSLIMRGVMKNAHDKIYTYKVVKGIDCFDFSKDLNVIATGGLDHVVRLWNPYVTVKPMATLRGHISRVLDVIIEEQRGTVYSYDCDTVIKAWDIKEHYCIQSIHLKYPYDPHHLDHGPFPMILLPAPTHALLIACEDYLTELKLSNEPNIKPNRTSHDRPLLACLYNDKKKQVITGCEGSLVRTWNVETGKKVFEFLGVVGKDEMSCMALEVSGRRLFTGSRTGMVYIWTSGSGQLLHKCLPEPGYEYEVTAIQPLPEKSYTLSVGWSKRILMYHDHDEMLSVKADPSWKGGHVHEDDILCIAHCHPNLVATGSFDGDLILWSLEKQNIFKRLKRGSGSLFKSKLKKVGLAAGHRKRLKSDSKQGSPVDGILFFERRANMKCQDSAILVSSQSGVLEFWSMFGPLKPRGSFYAPPDPGCTVLGLATDRANDILISGDTAGYVTVWDIKEYCNLSLEMVVTKAWMTAKASSEDQHNFPPRQFRWRAHTQSIVSLQVVSQFQQDHFILSASTDCTAKLWTINGVPIGMFDQDQTWNISQFLASEYTEEKPEEKSEKNLNGVVPKNHKRRPHTSDDVFTSSSQTLLKTSRKPSSEWTSNDSVGIERSLTESWILGDKYNKSFERRMMDRKTRRDNLGHVDTSLTTGGGLGTSCSPFQALYLLTSDEFELPRDLPFTPRMRTGSKLLSDRDDSWKNNQASLNLPPILSDNND